MSVAHKVSFAELSPVPRRRPGPVPSPGIDHGARIGLTAIDSRTPLTSWVRRGRGRDLTAATLVVIADRGVLGNDGDSDTPSGPVKTVDKKSTRTAKGGADGEAPARGALASSTRRGGYSGSEAGTAHRPLAFPCPCRRAPGAALSGPWSSN